VIIYDDYGLRSCPGARTAVDEFFAGKPEIPIVLSSGHRFVVKTAPPV
jgi:O-methyltransferase